jgi:hypothetical protein
LIPVVRDRATTCGPCRARRMDELAGYRV